MQPAPANTPPTRAQTAPLVVLMLCFCAAVFFSASLALQKPFDDLPSFYWASQLTWEEHTSPYQQQYFDAIGQETKRKIYPFLYPPPSLYLFSPLLLCSDYTQCKTVFTTLSALLWCGLGLVVLLLLRNKASLSVIGLALAWIWVFAPIDNTLGTGQINLFILALITPLFFKLQNHRTQYIAGFCLGLAICLKLYLALLLVPLLLAKQWKVIAATLGCLGVLIAVSALSMPELWQDWLTLRLPYGGYGKRIPGVLTVPWNQSLNGFVIRGYLEQGILNGQTPGATLTYLANGLLFLLACLFAHRAISQQEKGLASALSLFLLLITLIAPLTWLHHYVFVIPSLAICLILSRQSKSLGLLTFLGLCALLITVPSITNTLFPHLAQRTFSPDSLSISYNLFLSGQLVAALGLFGLLCWQIQRR